MYIYVVNELSPNAVDMTAPLWIFIAFLMVGFMWAMAELVLVLNQKDDS